MTHKVYNVLFNKIFRQISTRIALFANMPIVKLEKAAIHRELTAIGDTPVSPT